MARSFGLNSVELDFKSALKQIAMYSESAAVTKTQEFLILGHFKDLLNVGLLLLWNDRK